MRKAAGLVLCALAASLAISVEPASACTCALGDPRAALARADAAFIGILVSKRLPPRITSRGDLRDVHVSGRGGGER